MQHNLCISSGPCVIAVQHEALFNVCFSSSSCLRERWELCCRLQATRAVVLQHKKNGYTYCIPLGCGTREHGSFEGSKAAPIVLKDCGYCGRGSQSHSLHTALEAVLRASCYQKPFQPLQGREQKRRPANQCGQARLSVSHHLCVTSIDIYKVTSVAAE